MIFKNNVSPIKKMYIVTNKQYFIELIHSFDEQTSNEIFNIIIKNREALQETFTGSSKQTNRNNKERLTVAL